MRTAQSLFVADQSLRRMRLLPLLLLTLTAGAALPVAPEAVAQTNSAPTAAKAAHKPAAHPHQHAKPAAPVTTVAVAQPAPLPEPPKPNWPVNNQPAPATIAWNASGLRIEAANASLQQILKEVSTLTGASVEGLGADERVFGVYGPGPAREVLARLLDGSSYNLLLIGDQGQGTPRHIVLTSRDGKGAAKPAASSADDDADDDVEPDDQQQQQQQPPQPPLVRNFTPGFNPGNNGRNAQQLQEMQQRQQQQPPQ